MGISASRLEDFERGTTKDGKYPSNPKRDLLERMAEVYQFPFATLAALAGSPVEVPPPPPVPSKAEVQAQELAELFRHLSDDHRELVLAMVRTFKAVAD